MTTLCAPRAALNSLDMPGPVVPRGSGTGLTKFTGSPKKFVQRRSKAKPASIADSLDHGLARIAGRSCMQRSANYKKSQPRPSSGTLAPPPACCHWRRQLQADTTGASLVLSTLSPSTQAQGLDALAAKLVAALQAQNLPVNRQTLLHAAGLLDVGTRLASGQPGRVAQLAPAELRRLAQDHVDRWAWGQGRPLRSSTAANSLVPKTSPRTSAEPRALASWTDQQISDGVDNLMRELGQSSQPLSQFMKSNLMRPGLSNEERALALGRSKESLVNLGTSVRKLLGDQGQGLRVALARRIGMPAQALLARSPVDGNVVARVFDSINPSHRETVAQLLLAAPAGGPVDTSVYPVLDEIFHGGDPYASRVVLARKLGVQPTQLQTTLNYLQKAFGDDRLAMLRTMGFGYEQILSMNPVGQELAQRLDPRLGQYSAAERALRAQKNLPTTREEAAERLLRAGAEQTGGTRPLSYRTWLVLGLVSDKPGARPGDLDAAFSGVSPNGVPDAASGELHAAFRLAQKLLGRDIPRGPRADLQDPRYLQEVNLLLLQTFGLGGRGLSGEVRTIATDFSISDWPAPAAAQRRQPQARAQAASRQHENVNWQQLLPLLKRPLVGGQGHT
jgi:hypothetical protein